MRKVEVEVEEEVEEGVEEWGMKERKCEKKKRKEKRNKRRMASLLLEWTVEQEKRGGGCVAPVGIMLSRLNPCTSH